jgi:hypothetical protein
VLLYLFQPQCTIPFEPTDLQGRSGSSVAGSHYKVLPCFWRKTFLSSLLTLVFSRMSTNRTSGTTHLEIGSGSIKKDRFSFSRRMMPSLNLWKWFPVIRAILLD